MTPLRAPRQNWALVVLLGGLLAASQWHLGAMLDPLQPWLPTLQLTWDPHAFAAILQGWRDAGHLPLYVRHFTWDTLHPLLYGAFGYVVATRTRVYDRMVPWLQRAATWAMPLAAAFDGLENAAHWRLLSLWQAGETLPSTLVTLSATAASLKWALIAVAAALLLLAITHRLLFRFFPKRREGAAR